MSARNLNKESVIRWRWAVMYGAVFCALWLIPLGWVLEDRVPLCLFRNVLGWECWGCGMTRAFFSLIHGHWEQAIRYNWRCVIVFPIIAYLCVKSILKRNSGDTEG